MALGISVRGVSSIMNKLIVVQTDKFMDKTIIHEVGHTYGLGHCSNLTCVMGIYNDSYDTGKFCENCRKLINYY